MGYLREVITGLSPDSMGAGQRFEPQTPKKRIELLTTTINEVNSSPTFNKFRDIYTFIKANKIVKDKELMTVVYYQSVQADGGYHDHGSEGLVIGINDGGFKRKYRFYAPETISGQVEEQVVDLKFLPFDRAKLSLPGNIFPQVSLVIDKEHSLGNLKAHQGHFEIRDLGEVEASLTSVLDVSIIDWHERLSSALEQVKKPNTTMAEETYRHYNKKSQEFLNSLQAYDVWLNSESGAKTAQAINGMIELIPAAPVPITHGNGVTNG